MSIPSSSMDYQMQRDPPSRPKEEVLKNMSDKTGKKMTNPLKLPEIFTYFDTPGKEKKWTAPNADITDYFNYGFTEELFKHHAYKVKALFNKLQKTGGAHFKQGESDKFFEDKLPISHGGLEIIDDKNLKDFSEENLDFLLNTGDHLYLDHFFTLDIDHFTKGIAEVNNSVNNVYGLKKEPPPNPPTSHMSHIQPPPPNTFQQAKPQPPVVFPPQRVAPPSMGMPNMYPPPSMHTSMDYSMYPPHQMMPQRNPYMPFPPQKQFDFNPMYQQPMMPFRPPMEMEMNLEDNRFEKKRREEKAEDSDESSDEREKGKSQGGDRRKRSKSKEKKQKSHRSEKDHSESRHHRHKDKEKERDRERDRHEREKKHSRSSKERDDGGHKSSRDENSHKSGKGGNWQMGLINNLLAPPSRGRDHKDRRSSK